MGATIGMALYSLNILLTLALLYIYWQNYQKLKSAFTIGLMIFAAAFFVQSAMGLYFDLSMVMYSSSQAQNAALVLEALKALSFAILLKISWE